MYNNSSYENSKSYKSKESIRTIKATVKDQREGQGVHIPLLL